jgi:hypothetical protein
VKTGESDPGANTDPEPDSKPDVSVKAERSNPGGNTEPDIH